MQLESPNKDPRRDVRTSKRTELIQQSISGNRVVGGIDTGETENVATVWNDAVDNLRMEAGDK